DEGEDLEHALRAGDDALERDTALQALLQDAGAVLELALLEDGLEHTLEAPEVDRFLDVVRGPELDRLDGIRHRRVGAHEHELDVGIALLQVAEQLEAAHLRHADVGEDHVDRLLVEHLQRSRRAVGRRSGGPPLCHGAAGPTRSCRVARAGDRWREWPRGPPNQFSTIIGARRRMSSVTPRLRARSWMAFQASLLGSACAFSQRLTVDTVTAISCANSSCVMPSF